MATKIFGNTVTLDDINIVESGLLYNIATRGNDGNYVTAHNTIYGKNMTDGTLIHEIGHVWQYSRGLLTPIEGLVKQGAGKRQDAREGRDQSIYYYSPDTFGDSDRRTFRDYNFEQQGQILQDAYEYLFEDADRLRFNEGFDGRSDYWQEYYETFLEEFQEYHRQLLDEESSSSGYLEFN